MRGDRDGATYPQLTTLPLYCRYEEQEKSCYNADRAVSNMCRPISNMVNVRGLASKSLQGSFARCPRQLEERHREPTKDAREVDKRGDFALVAWEAVVQVCVYGCAQYLELAIVHGRTTYKRQLSRS